MHSAIIAMPSKIVMVDRMTTMTAGTFLAVKHI